MATQCLWVLLRHWYLPDWHCLGCWGSPGCLQMGPPQKQVWPGHTVGIHGEPHGRGGMHRAGNGMELAQPVLVGPSVPSWGGLGPLLCLPHQWNGCMWLSTLWGLGGSGDDAASQSFEEEGDEWCLRSQARDHGRGFCLGLVSEGSAGLLAMSPCPAGSILPWQVGHWSTHSAMGPPQPSRKGVNPISILPCLEDSGPSPALMAMGPAGLQPPEGRGKGEHHHTPLWRT